MALAAANSAGRRKKDEDAVGVEPQATALPLQSKDLCRS
jgi:hypothetical protein